MGPPERKWISSLLYVCPWIFQSISIHLHAFMCSEYRQRLLYLLAIILLIIDQDAEICLPKKIHILQHPS